MCVCVCVVCVCVCVKTTHIVSNRASIIYRGLDTLLFYNMLIVFKAVEDILTIPIIDIGLCTSCGIRVDVGKTCAVYAASLQPAVI